MKYYDTIIAIIILIVVVVTVKTKTKLETCESNLELLSTVYCQQLKILKYSGSTNSFVLELIQEEEDNPLCIY